MIVRRWGLILLLLVAGTGAVTVRDRLDQIGKHVDPPDHMLYLPNGKHLKLLSVGHSSLFADWLYVWAIQYYSNYERADRYRYVEHVFGDVIAELDPHYVDPYWLGALILIVEAGDLDAGLRLLDKGFEANPEQWVLPYLAGWECYRADQFGRAGAYFDRAAAVSGAPRQVRRIRAAVAARGGDPGQAMRLWQAVLEDPRSEPAERAIARRHLRAVRVDLDLQRLAAAILAYRQGTGGYPPRLKDLLTAGVTAQIPLDPDGNPYRYDSRTGTVSSAAGRVLGGSR